MDTQKHKFEHMEVSVFAQQVQVINQVLRGRVLIDPGDQRCLVVENPPRGQRSREIGRTMHARIVERPDGDFTITFRIKRKEKYKRESMIAECRALAKIMEEITKIEKKTYEQQRIEKNDNGVCGDSRESEVSGQADNATAGD